MAVKIEEWGTFKDVGNGYSFKHEDKFYAVLETRVGAYRGNHIHPFDQYTILLSGKATYIKYEDPRIELPLTKGEPLVVRAGVPHVLNVAEDCLTFEWWDGDFVTENCTGLFDEIIKDRVGPKTS